MGRTVACYRVGIHRWIISTVVRSLRRLRGSAALSEDRVALPRDRHDNKTGNATIFALTTFRYYSLPKLILKDPQMTTPRIAIITGATAGIGEAIARDLASSGVSLVINGRRAEKLKNLQKELGESRVTYVAGDAAAKETVVALFEESQKKFGREADIVVVNAGRGLKGSVVTSDTSQWEELLRTNIIGAQLLIREAATRMIAEIQKSGVGKRPLDIVVLGSIVGRHISPWSSAYGATKFAVNSMAEAVRRELAPHGIRVTLIEPGIVKSEFQGVAEYDAKWFADMEEKSGPFLEPGDVAKAISFIVGMPWRVHVNDIVIRPTRQEYP